MFLTNTPQSGKSYVHMWDVSSTEVFEGGFRPDASKLPAGLEKLPRGVFIKVDLTERTCVVVKTAVLQAAVTALSTEVRVKKDSLLVDGDTVGIGEKYVTIETLDTSNSAYDSFAITAEALGVLAIGTVLQQYTAAGVIINPDGLNYADRDLDAEPSCSVIFKAYGIVPEALPQGVTDAIIAALGKCQFLKK